MSAEGEAPNCEAPKGGGFSGWGAKPGKRGGLKVGAPKSGASFLHTLHPHPGGSHNSPRTPNVHISGPRPSKTPPKFNEKTPKREKKERKLWRERGKKGEILGGPAERGSGGERVWRREGGVRLRGVRPNLGRTNENLEDPTDTPHLHTTHLTTQDNTTQHKTTQHKTTHKKQVWL